MKTKTFITILAIGMLAVSCVSDEEMLTVVNPDGTCYREFTRNVDSAFIVGDTAKTHYFPVTIDSSWEITWKYLTPEIHTNWPLKTWKWAAGDTVKRLEVTARKDFESVSQLDNGFRLASWHEWNTLKVNHTLDKKFRWFYTYYTYKEVYPKIKTFDDVPFDKYMTKEETDFWFTGKPDLVKGMNGLEMREYAGKLEGKYNSWFAHNYWNLQYQNLLDNYDQLAIRSVSKQRMIQARDSAFTRNLPDMLKGDDVDVKIDVALDKYFKTTEFSVLKSKKDNLIDKFDKEFDSLEFMAYFNKAFDYMLLLPGKILQPGNGTLHGDTLSWKLTAYRMVPGNYEITAESRKANAWAFIVTGCIVVMAIGSFFIKTKR